jgi:toxin HigB-1
MISTFRNQGTEDIFNGSNTAAARKTLPTDLWNVAFKKLSQLNAATAVGDMRLPPGNKLEKLSGNRAGQWSVRINDQYRICFTFDAGSVSAVEVTDYH